MCSQVGGETDGRWATSYAAHNPAATQPGKAAPASLDNAPPSPHGVKAAHGATRTTISDAPASPRGIKTMHGATAAPAPFATGDNFA